VIPAAAEKSKKKNVLLPLTRMAVSPPYGEICQPHASLKSRPVYPAWRDLFVYAPIFLDSLAPRS
jgi:hypothetical protein